MIRIQVCSKEGPHLSPRGVNYEVAKKKLTKLKKKNFSRTTWLMSTKLDTKHPWLMGILVCSNKRSHPFPRRDTNEKAKFKNLVNHWTNFNPTLHKASLDEGDLMLNK